MKKTFDFVGVISTLTATQNPEIWHADNNIHPGLGWTIKTVVPKAAYADETSVAIVEFWQQMHDRYFNLVMITDVAYDWAGNVLPEWSTVWVMQGWDIEAVVTDTGALSHKIRSIEKGLALHAESLIDSIGHQLAQLENIEDREELLELIESCEVLASHVTEQECETTRRNFKVVDDGV